MNELLELMVKPGLLILAGVMGYLLKKYFDGMDVMHKNTANALNKRIDLEIEILETQITNLNQKVDILSAKMDRIYELLLEMKKG